MFVIVEGANGAGKTTLINNLSSRGCQTLSSPNGTPLAKMLRPACRGTEPWQDIDKKVQFLLFSAARLDEYIRLVHNKPNIVVADRWWTSTYVYQCCFQGISTDFLLHTIHPEEKIDLIILLDAKNEVLVERVKKEREANATHGICRWTQKDEDVFELARIYRDDLPDFVLSKFKIPVVKVDTTVLTENQVLEHALNLIDLYNLPK